MSKLPHFSQLYKEAFPSPDDVAQSLPITPAVPRRPFTNEAPRASVSSAGTNSYPHWSQPGHDAPPSELLLAHSRQTSQQSTAKQSDLIRLEAEKQALSEELEKVKNLYELKLIMDSKKDEDLQQLRRELDRRQTVPTNNKTRPSSSTTVATKVGSAGWDLTGLLRDGAKVWSSGRNSDTESRAGPNDLAKLREASTEINKLREALTTRSKQLMQSQGQLEEMENYLHREREAFQAEVDNRNRRIQEIKSQWEREKEISANIMREKLDLVQQLDQNQKELQRRENWVKDLTARVNRQETQISTLESEIEAKRSELDKTTYRLQRLQYRLDRFEANLRVFACHKISPFQKTPITLILQQTPQTGSFVCILQHWDHRQVIEFYQIVNVQLTSVPSTSIGRWTFRGISGRILEWWGSDLIFINNNERLVPKRAAFFGDYSFDQISNENRPPTNNNGRQVRVLVIQTSTIGTVAFCFDEDDLAEECHQAFQFFLKSAAAHERELRENQRIYCLCEMEAFMYGDAGEEPPHPPVRSLPGSNTLGWMTPALPPPPPPDPRPPGLASSPWTQQALSDTRSLRAMQIACQHERLPSGRPGKLSECASETMHTRRDPSEHGDPPRRPPLRPSPSLGPSPSGSEPTALHRRLPPFAPIRHEYDSGRQPTAYV